MKSILFQPLEIGGLHISNRIVMPAMTTNYADAEGGVTERTITYYRTRAEGGAGLIVVEPVSVELRGKRLSGNLVLFSEKHVPGLARLAAKIKETGTRAFLQLNHGGRECIHQVTGEQPVGPSAIASPYPGIKSQGENPRALTIDEIREVEEAFARAALWARQAGFDGVEIHGAHGYLISQFCSPLINLRTDRYGFDLKGRALFFQEIIRRCREKAGPGFPVIARMNARDYVEGGLEVREALEIARLLQAAGAHALHVSVGTHASRPYLMIPGMHAPRACNAELTRQFKAALKVPVICVGRINDPRVAEEVITSGAGDFAALGRPLVADPDFPRKAEQGADDIRMCLACNEGCIGRIHAGKPMSCAVNAAVGREAEVRERLAIPLRKRKVFIAGGGPAGLEVARVAALRGAKVTLWEKEADLGGQINIAVLPPGRQEIGNVLAYYKTVLPKLRVSVKTGKRATRESIRAQSPDAVVIASGAIPFLPSIPGVDQKHVVKAWDVLAGAVTAGEKCVVIGAGPVGMETAEFLAEKGRKTALLDLLSWTEVAKTYVRPDAVFHEAELQRLGIEFYGPVTVEEIGASSVTYAGKNWRKSLLDVDTVILATGARVCADLIAEFAGTGIPHTAAGDCTGTGKIIDAIHAGFAAALDLK